MLVQSLDDGFASWELASRPVPTRFRGLVRTWLGYSERAAGIRRQRELPGARVVVIFEFGPPIRVSATGSERCETLPRGGFVAAIHRSFAMTEHDGEQAGIQVDLTPLAARRIFGMPLAHLHDRTVSLPDVIGDASLGDQLAELRTWQARFDRVERVLEQRLHAGPTTCPRVAWATGQIEARGGQIQAGALARELGCSRKHLAALFHDQVGCTPKLYAKIARFQRLVAAARAPEPPRWADLALELGFSDQAHLAREVRSLSGVTPSGLRDQFSPVTNVQDEQAAAR